MGLTSSIIGLHELLESGSPSEWQIVEKQDGVNKETKDVDIKTVRQLKDSYTESCKKYFSRFCADQVLENDTQYDLPSLENAFKEEYCQIEGDTEKNRKRAVSLLYNIIRSVCKEPRKGDLYYDEYEDQW